MKKVPLLDVFCGAGGLSAGFEQSGFEAVFANDIDPHATATFAENHSSAKVFTGDVQELTGRKVLKQSGHDRIPVVIGGPNCQGVSLRGKRDPDDPKNLMFFHYKRLIKELKPDWFVMENVPGLMHRHNRDLITSIFEAFDSIGYRCGGEVLLAADYGVPQLRYRFILIGNRHGEPIHFPEPTHRCPPLQDERADLFDSAIDRGEAELPEWRHAREALIGLPPLENGGGDDVSEYPPMQQSQLTEYERYCLRDSGQLFNHRAHRSPSSNIELIKHIPAGKNWKAIPEEIRPARFKHVALKDHTTTYGRLRWDMPARTITTYFNNISSGAFTHPEQHRGISVREGARLQSFPDRFRFLGPLSKQYRQVGNAVPPMLASAIADQVRESLAGATDSTDRVHPAAVEYSRASGQLKINQPLKGMRFNLDRYLVRG